MKIISGGQAGADRGALEAARELDFPYGGWIPKGRRAEDGKIPACFDQLQEHGHSEYPPRTWANVRDSDATVIFAKAPLSGGSKLTARYCREQEKPFIIFSTEKVLWSPTLVLTQLKLWLESNDVSVLNVAGSRESKAKGLQAAVRQLVRSLLVTRPGSLALGYWICEGCQTMHGLTVWTCACGGKRKVK